jgi:flagellar P-ring protein precursor FlgI
VVVNSRTGTVVINQQVKISAAAVSHGTVSVSVSTLNEVSQPGPFTEGRGVETRDVANSVVEVNESTAQTGLIAEEIDLKDIVDSIKQSGASTTSLIAILEALKSAGSLKAELVVI